MTFFADEFDPADRYSTQPNHWFRDPRLSLKAKGLLGYFKGHKPGYRLTVEQMIAETKDGKDAIYTALGELRTLGYVERVRETAKGKVVSISYKWGPAAYEQQYERAWGTQPTDTAESGKGGVSAGQTTSGKSGSGKTGSGNSRSGESATKKTSTKKTSTKENQTPPTPREEEAPPAAVVEAEEDRGGNFSSNPKTPEEVRAEQVAAAVDAFCALAGAQELAARYRNWQRPVVLQAITDAVAAGRGDAAFCVATLLRLAKGEFGRTESARRVLEPGRWWPQPGGIPAFVPAQRPDSPMCETHPTFTAKGCGPCHADAKAAPTADDRGSVDPKAAEAGRRAEEALRRRRADGAGVSGVFAAAKVATTAGV